MKKSRKIQNDPRGFFAYLVTTAAVCGGLVMVVEILGSRVIGPFFGVSLFVWTSLITVTLVALAAGYAVGGVLSDQKASPDMLYGVILLAGLFALFVPILKGVVLKSAMGLGLRAGALTSAFVLFGPTLFLLGCVSPYLVKLSAHEISNIGRTVGMLYAVSTAGSFIGTVLTGFYLMAFLGVNTAFWVVGATLIVLSAGYFLFWRRNVYVLAALFFSALLIPTSDRVSVVMANGTTATQIFNMDTYYGNLKVIDYYLGVQRHRDLMIDGSVQGGIDVNNSLPLYEYIYFMQFLPMGTIPDGRTCLVLGVGAGLIPRWYEQHGVKTDVVEIDPHIVELARRYFGFAVSGDVVIADARYFLNTSVKQYDYIVLDVFNGDTTPAHLLSIEALRLLREHLTERGVLAINLIGSFGDDRFMTVSVIRTLEEVFKAVRAYPIFDPSDGEKKGNIAILALNDSALTFNQRAVSSEPVHPAAEQGVRLFMRKEYHLPDDDRATLLTDDYNPFDFYDVRLKEWMRGAILKNIDPDILL